MAVITSYWIFDFFLLIVSFFVLGYLNFYFVSRHYWSKRKFPQTEPHFIVGNAKEINVTKSLPEALDDIYRANRDKPFVGFWLYVRPMVLVRDLSLIKNILVKDFNHFRDRGFHADEEKEPLAGNLFSLEGAKWRHSRVKLTPTFTSGKMKMMFSTMMECGKELQNFLEKPAETKGIVEMKDAVSRFTVDTISSCAFGLEANSFKNPDSEFRVQGRKIFKPSVWIMIQNMLAFTFPAVEKLVTLRRFDKDMSEFFLRVVKETIEHREKHGIKRKDFMDLLIQLKNKGYVEDPDAEDTDKEKSGSKFTTEQAAAHAFIFFIAGFETASTLMIFALYELAKNPNVLKILQNEIDENLAKHKALTYDGLQEMEYLDQVIEESLRLYPPAGNLFRECNKDYPIPGTDLIIEKGTSVMIPTGSIGRDPDFFPDPESFRPERFSPEERKKRDHFSHLPFGEGPRNCIGSRFGLMQAKIGLTSILSKYSVEICEESPIPLKLDPRSGSPTPVNGMKLRITNRA